MSKSKGFTLVEVLATIVILGILSAIGIVSITNLRANQANKFDQTQRELFKETAKTYFSDNKSKLPTVSEGTNKVYLEDLINENYIDSLLDYDKKSYQTATSYVEVIKVGSEYTYNAHLYPEGATADKYIQPTDTNKTDINFKTYKKSNNKDMTFDKDKDNNPTRYYTNQSAKVNVEINDSDGIKAFHYVIYKNNNKVYTGTFINPNGSEKELDVITLDANDYEDGTYEIEVIVYDKKDFVKSDRSVKIMIDRVAPSCTTEKKPAVEWTNTDVKVSGTCTDNQGKTKGNSGCVKETISTPQLISASGSYTPGLVEDKAGNKTQCEKINVNIDKTKPTVTLKATSQNPNYNTTTANVTVNINDDNATKYELSTSNYPTKTYSQMPTIGINGNNVSSMNVHSTYDDGATKTIYVTVKDVAGNEATANTTYKVYKRCTNKVANGNPTNGACSASCGSGTRIQTQAMKDAYLANTSCPSVSSTVSCGTLPPCCTGPTITTKTVTECPVCYGTASVKDGVIKLDMNNLPSKKIEQTTVECNGKKHVDYYYESCDSTPHCFSKPTKKDCDKCGVGTCKITSKYDTSKSISFKYSNTKCAKNKCYVGTKKYETKVHYSSIKPTYKMKKISYALTNGNCETATSGHWFYCSGSDGKLWTRFNDKSGKSPFTFNNFPTKARFACPNIKFKTRKDNTKYAKINGKNYDAINDSNDFWKKCTPEPYVTGKKS